MSSLTMDSATLGFDPDWYVNTYPDIALAGVDPWEHYCQHGRYEGRAPCLLLTWKMESLLWGSQQVRQIARFKSWVEGGEPLKEPERMSCAWFLARRYAFEKNWPLALSMLDALFQSEIGRFMFPHRGPLLLRFSCLYGLGHVEEARALVESGAREDLQDCPDLLLARARCGQFGPTLNALYASAGLRELQFVGDIRRFDDLARVLAKREKSASITRGPVVSVLMPVRNAESTLRVAIDSVLAQSWRNLELIIIDDDSEDGTLQLARAMAKRDSRVQTLRLDRNMGPYVARNLGLSVARGEYVTCHDGDDWSHPQKIELQLNGLAGDSGAVASISHWARCSDDFEFNYWRIQGSWIHRNISSLMFRRVVFDELGYWDRVAVDGDTEFLKRMEAHFGARCVLDIKPGTPLAFGRQRAVALTAENGSGLGITGQIEGLRKDYQVQASGWHAEAAKRPRGLFMEARPFQRKFMAPGRMTRASAATEIELNDDESLLRRDRRFSSSWYLSKYPDVAESGLPPEQHYLRFGWKEGRDPGPGFSTTGFQYAALQDNAVENPFVAYLRTLDKEQQHVRRLCAVTGDVPAHYGSRVLVVGHAAGPGVYGAERSLLDILYALKSLGYSPIVTLPAAKNPEYVEAVRSASEQLLIFPYSWWKFDQSPSACAIANFSEVIQKYNVAFVHINTSVLLEPCLAARLLRIPMFLHVREMPNNDPELCSELGGTPEEIRARIVAMSDVLLVNSTAAENYYAAGSPIFLIPNRVRLNLGHVTGPFEDINYVRIGMVSSNSKKKGVADLRVIAEQCAEHLPTARFVVIGPNTEDIAEWRRSEPHNVDFHGYLPTSEEAISRIDVLLNLSNFEESFGRTVAEAMLAKRPVICYDSGALSELVENGATGWVVPTADINSVVAAIRQCINDRNTAVKMGRSGYRKIMHEYSDERFVDALRNAYESVLQTIS